MDLAVVADHPYALPSAQRVGAIFYEGAADLRLWPRSGPDRLLREFYGDGLAANLDRARETLTADTLAVGDVLRLQPGRLHCDFLLWLATRPADGELELAPAAAPSVIEAVLPIALRFAADRHVLRVAMPLLGEGPGAANVAARAQAVAAGCRAYEVQCSQTGTAQVIETLTICTHERSTALQLGRLLGAPLKSADKAQAVKKVRSSSAKSPRRSRSSTPKIDVEAYRAAALTAPAYDKSRTFGPGDWLNHSRFGVGQVQSVTPENFIVVRFVDGSERKMVHAR
ncbi:MAG: hypothetical protein ACPGUV_10875 [Polyangiales bacterium]